MISFDTDGRRFNLRAAAVALDGSRVLLHRMDGDDFWTFPGGRVESGELAAATVVREMSEELAEPVSCGELVWVVENFFVYRGVPHHELGLYFRVELEPRSRLLVTPGPYLGADAGVRLTFAWFDRSELHALEIRPSFAAAVLASPQLQFRHIVHRDEDPVR